MSFSSHRREIILGIEFCKLRVSGEITIELNGSHLRCRAEDSAQWRIILGRLGKLKHVRYERATATSDRIQNIQLEQT